MINQIHTFCVINNLDKTIILSNDEETIEKYECYKTSPIIRNVNVAFDKADYIHISGLEDKKCYTSGILKLNELDGFPRKKDIKYHKPHKWLKWMKDEPYNYVQYNFTLEGKCNVNYMLTKDYIIKIINNVKTN